MNDDSPILSDFQKGNLSSTYEVLYKPLLIFASKKLTDKFSFLAEDCVQEAIFKAYTKRKEFNSEMSFKSYLYLSVRNKAIDILRNSNAGDRYLRITDTLDEGSINDFIEQDVLNQLYLIVDKLPERERQLFFDYSDGLSTKEIAKKLGLSESMIKRNKASMIAHLSESMSDEMLLLVLFPYLSTIIS